MRPIPQPISERCGPVRDAPALELSRTPGIVEQAGVAQAVAATCLLADSPLPGEEAPVLEWPVHCQPGTVISGGRELTVSSRSRPVPSSIRPCRKRIIPGLAPPERFDEVLAVLARHPDEHRAI